MRQCLGLLLDDLDARDRRTPRPLLAEANERLHRVPLSLEDCLDRSVSAVAHPSRDAVGRGRARGGDAEPHALDSAVHDDPATHHGDGGYVAAVERVVEHAVVPNRVPARWAVLVGEQDAAPLPDSALNMSPRLTTRGCGRCHKGVRSLRGQAV